MKAARLHAYGQPLVLDELPMPQPAPGQVVIRVGGAGFCHSDIHVIDGELKILPRMPLTLGHENAGIVSAVGAGVTAVEEGDAVAVYGGWGCGQCDYCVTGHEQLCETPQWGGLSQYDGGYAEYLLVPHERYLVPLSTLKPEYAAPLEVQFEATLWGTIKELREVIALAETGQLTSIPIELAPLEHINDVYARLKRGEIQGRAVITPAA